MKITPLFLSIVRAWTCPIWTRVQGSSKPCSISALSSRVWRIPLEPVTTLHESAETSSTVKKGCTMVRRHLNCFRISVHKLSIFLIVKPGFLSAAALWQARTGSTQISAAQLTRSRWRAISPVEDRRVWNPLQYPRFGSILFASHQEKKRALNNHIT